MKKRIYLLILSLLTTFACAFGLAACNSKKPDGGNENEHTMHAWSSTYTEDGNRHYQTCSGCNEKKYGEHSYNSIGYCICGKTKPDDGEVNPPAHTEHTYNKKVVDSKYLKQPATCEHTAEYYYSCECGKQGTETFEYGELLQHTPKAAVRENEVPATCTKGGSYDEVVRCAVCDEIISSTPKTVEKLAHTPKAAARENEVPATCTKEGSYDEVVRCSICNEVISSTPKTVEKLAHTPKAAVRENEVPATCTKEGSYDEVIRCAVCNEVISSTPKTVDKVAHTPKEATKENIVVATWEQDGSYDLVVRCNACNAVLSSEHFTEKKKPVGTEIHSNTLTLDGDTLYGKLPNGTEIFRFAGDITVADGASYYLCSDITGTQVIPTKIAPLQTGDNIYYLVVENGNADPMTYTVTLRVRPLYTVSFETTGGAAIEAQIVEEDGFASQPNPPTLWLGYTFTGWTYDFTKPITRDTVVQSITLKDEMQNFVFTSDEETCVITGITDKTVTEIVVPDYVTEIAKGAFDGCSNLESITLPFIGRSRNTNEQAESVFGFIFGYTITYTSNYVTHGTAPSGSTMQYSYSASNNNDIKTYYRYYYHIPLSLKNVILSQAVTSIGNEVFNSCSSLTSITIPNSVTSIGNSAFRDCSRRMSVNITDLAAWCNISFGNETSNPLYYARNFYFNGERLTDLNIPNGVTSIGNYAFYNCSSLTNITVPNSVTSIGDYAFYNCSELTSITVPNSVTSIGNRAFENCSGLQSIAISNGVTSIGEEAFRNCSSLTSITIPNSVTSIGEKAFYGCSSLTSISIPFVGATLNGTENTKFGYIFGGESYGESQYGIPETLKSVTITGGNTIADFAFSGCSSLEIITISNGVTIIGKDAFQNCSGLTSITISNGVTSIGDYAFYNCSGLTSIMLPKSVTSIGEHAFYGCDGLTSITVTEGNPKLHSSGNCIIETESKTLLVGCKNSLIPSDGSVTNIGNYAFWDCSGLTSITIPNSVTSIGDSAFSGCSGLTSITIPNSVTTIGNSAFSGCSGIMSVNITDLAVWCNITFGYGTSNPLYYAHNLYFNGERLTDLNIPIGVTNIGNYAFYNCSSLTSITVPNSVTSIGDYAFYNCSGLQSIAISNGVTSIGEEAFRNCSSLTSITIPNSVTSIGEEAFGGCSGLESITLPFVGGSANATSSSSSTLFGYIFGESSYTGGTSTTQYYASGSKVTYYIPTTLRSVTITGGSIFYGGFWNCSGLTSISIGNDTMSIGWYAFSGCCSLTNFTVPDSVASIESFAFSRCSSLIGITISGSVASIGSGAFLDCSNLETVYFGGTAEEWRKISIVDTNYNNFNLKNATRYYYSESEPELNADGTAYNGNYWYYDENGKVKVWLYTEDSNEV